jgi:hypothetical protein
VVAAHRRAIRPMPSPPWCARCAPISTPTSRDIRFCPPSRAEPNRGSQ